MYSTWKFKIRWWIKMKELTFSTTKRNENLVNYENISVLFIHYSCYLLDFIYMWSLLEVTLEILQNQKVSWFLKTVGQKIKIFKLNIYFYLDFVIKERSRRDALRQDDNQNRRNIDSSQIPSANVEFIHPKLKDEMSDEEDPENPWVWLTSFSRVPVSIFHTNSQWGLL